MCKEKIKENKFLSFLKNNPKSILGVISGFIASIAGGAVTAGGMLWGNVQLPLWAVIVIGVVVCIALFVLIALGVNGAGFEGPTKKALRLLANKLGFTKAVEALDKVEQEYEAEEAAKAEAEKIEQERIQAKYKEAWRIDVLNGNFEGSLDAYIEEKQKAEAEAAAKLKEEQDRLALEEQKRQYRSAVANNAYTGSFTDWQAEYQAK